MPFWKSKQTKKPTTSSPEREDFNQSPQVQAMRRVINEKEPSNSLIRAQITGKDITTYTLNVLKDERGVRIESCLGVLGSLAGASCSYAMLDSVAKGLKMEAPEVAIATLKSGEHVMFGDYINRKLVDGEKFGSQTLSLWHLFAGMAQHHLGELPKIDLDPHSPSKSLISLS